MTEKVISADTHMDIVWLPEDLFVANAPDSLKAQMPRVVETDEGKLWEAEGTSFGVCGGGGIDRLLRTLPAGEVEAVGPDGGDGVLLGCGCRQASPQHS